MVQYLHKSGLHLLVLSVMVATCSDQGEGAIELEIKEDHIVLHKWQPAGDLSTHETSVSLHVWDPESSQINEQEVEGRLVRMKDGTIAYQPLFPFDQRTSYLFRWADGTWQIEHFIQEEREDQAAPVVTEIYPTSDSLPTNLLRMYICFSQSMKTVGNLEKIKLMDDQGKEVNSAIFGNIYELWDQKQKQLTILFDPARVKTGLQANQILGRALNPRRSYRLVLSGLEDIDGRPIRETFVKEIHVVSPDTIPPRIEDWQLTSPEARSQFPLIVRFPTMLDRLSLMKCLKVFDRSGKEVKGRIELDKQETEWLFFPDAPWKKGDYIIRVNARLEDPAGNNLNGLFDHEIGALKWKKEGESLDLKFAINNK